jgi:hypothetical protein
MTWQNQLVAARSAAAKYSDATVRGVLSAQSTAISAALTACTTLAASGAPNATRARASQAYLSHQLLAKIPACQAALVLCGYDFTATAVSSFLGQVGALIGLSAYASSSLATAITAAAPVVSAVVGIGGTAPGTAYVTTARAYIASVNKAAETALSALATALALPVDPSTSPAARALPIGATEAQRLVEALAERFNTVWWTTAQADTASLVSAGAGAAGVRLALDQAASTSGAVKMLYPAAEAPYGYLDTFGIRAGE